MTKVEIRDLDADEMFDAIEVFKKERVTDEKINDAAIHWLILYTGLLRIIAKY